MLANYGYEDGSGEYFIIIDTDKCDGCEKCADACPYQVLEVVEDPNDPFREIPVAVVRDEQRKRIKYACAPCKPMTGERRLPCVTSCQQDAISHSW